MDVKSVFLYGKIEEEVYVFQPPGFEDPDFLDRVYKVEKALYGLHQGPRAWFTEVKTTSTPIETQKPLLKDEDGEEVDVHMYRSMIGSLMYLTSSRPNIMFVVCACARYQVNPKVSHLHAVKRIFRYLKGQPKLGLWYLKDSPFDLVAYTDSDYAGASLDRKSTTGGCQFLRCRLISWQCKKQIVVANSTTEAKYVAALSSSVRRDLKLEDEEGVDCLPNSTIFEQLALMGYEKISQQLTFYKNHSVCLTMEISESYYSTMSKCKDNCMEKQQEVAAKDVNLTIDEVTLSQALAALKSVKKVKIDEVGKDARAEEEKIDKQDCYGETSKQKLMLETSWLKDCKLKNRLLKEKMRRGTNHQPKLNRRRARLLTSRTWKVGSTKIYLVEGSSKRAGEELEQESTKKQKVDDDKETAELKQCLEIIPDEEEVEI
ncbi:uncharacterized mitochondrial protein-like protein [Tanacetum coccineum]